MPLRTKGAGDIVAGGGLVALNVPDDGGGWCGLGCGCGLGVGVEPRNLSEAGEPAVGKQVAAP